MHLQLARRGRSLSPRQGPPQTDDSVLRAKAAMHAERIKGGFCPVCEPIRRLDDFGYCSNLFCMFAAFASPHPSGPGLIDDPRR